ncbi:MAG: hypothetical protein QXU97_05280 [Fervidicoccaceae archaeon]
MRFESGLVGAAEIPLLARDPSEYLRSLGLVSDVGDPLVAVDLLNAWDKLEETLREALEKKKYPYAGRGDAATEVVLFHAALRTIALFGDARLWRVFSTAVSKSFAEKLKRADEKLLVEVARTIGVQLRRHEANDALKVLIALTASGYRVKVYGFSVPLKDYLRLSRRLRADPRWKLTNQRLLRGRVYLDKRKVLRLLEEAMSIAVSRIIEEYSTSGSPLDERLKRRLEELWGEVRRELEAPETSRIETSLERVELGPLDRGALPPCLAALLARAESGENLSHHERFALATFLAQVGVGEEQIVDIFRGLPDFDEKKTRYQVEHLLGKRGGGKKYFTYGCDKMRTLGLCVADCGTKTPVEAYIARLGRSRRAGGEDGGGQG